MAFKFEKVASGIVLGETLWLTAGEDEVVADGDERAAFLLGTEGQEIPTARAEAVGLVKPAAKSKSKSATAEEPEE